MLSNMYLTICLALGSTHSVTSEFLFISRSIVVLELLVRLAALLLRPALAIVAGLVVEQIGAG